MYIPKDIECWDKSIMLDHNLSHNINHLVYEDVPQVIGILSEAIIGHWLVLWLLKHLRHELFRCHL